MLKLNSRRENPQKVKQKTETLVFIWQSINGKGGKE